MPDSVAKLLSSLGEHGRAILLWLGEHGPSSKTAMYEATSLNRWRGDKAVDRLELLGWVEWKEDGPAKMYELTPAGQEAFNLCLAKKEEFV